MAFGVMLWGFLLPVLWREAGWLMEATSDGSPWMRSSFGGKSTRILFNKRVFVPDPAEAVLLFPSSGHRGDGQRGRWWLLLRARDGKLGIKAASKKFFGSSSLAVLNPMVMRRPLPSWSLASGACKIHATRRTFAALESDTTVVLCWPSIFVADGRLLSTPWRRMFNLRMGRPFFDFTTSFNVFLSPSGMFPGCEEDGWRWSLFRSGNKGLDRVLSKLFRVLCAYF